jgi:hypothetical protein
MKFVYRNSFSYFYDDLVMSKDCIYAINQFHLYRLDKTTFKVIEEYQDFLCPRQMVMTPDEHYLITVAQGVGYNLYDLTQKPLVGKPHFFAHDERHPLSMSFSKDSKSLYVIYAGKIPASGNPFIEGDAFASAQNLKLFRYTLPNLDSYDILDTDKKFIRTHLLPALDSQLLLSQSLDFYLMNGTKITPAPLPKFSSDLSSLVVDDKRQQLILQDKFGIRIYDKQFREINKIDLISDEKEDVSSDVYHFNNDMPMDVFHPDPEEMTVYKQQILDVMLFKEDYLLIHSADALQETSFLSLISLETGKPLAKFVFGRMISNLLVAGNYLVFNAMMETVLLEVTHD